MKQNKNFLGEPPWADVGRQRVCVFEDIIHLVRIHHAAVKVGAVANAEHVRELVGHDDERAAEEAAGVLRPGSFRTEEVFPRQAEGADALVELG